MALPSPQASARIMPEGPEGVKTLAGERPMGAKGGDMPYAATGALRLLDG
jgi:hypothetical protein